MAAASRSGWSRASAWAGTRTSNSDCTPGTPATGTARPSTSASPDSTRGYSHGRNMSWKWTSTPGWRRGSTSRTTKLTSLASLTVCVVSTNRTSPRSRRENSSSGTSVAEMGLNVHGAASSPRMCGPRVGVKDVVDRVHPVGSVAPAGDVDQERAVAGSELDDASRTHRADHRVEELGVDRVEAMVAEKELARNAWSLSGRRARRSPAPARARRSPSPSRWTDRAPPRALRRVQTSSGMRERSGTGL